MKKVFHQGNGFNFELQQTNKGTTVRRYHTNGHTNEYEKIKAWQPGNKHEIKDYSDAERFWSKFYNAKNWIGAPWNR